MKLYESPDAYKNCIGFFSIIAFSNLVPLLNDFSVLDPVLKFLTFILTNAAPFPGFTCENSSTVNISPSKTNVIPFFTSFTLNINPP